MNERLTRALTEVERGLVGIGHDKLLHLLRPGLTPVEIDALMATAGLTPTDEIRAVYAWRDGTSGEGAVLGEMYLLYSFYLSSLEDALASHHTFTAETDWNPSWLPILADDGGDFLIAHLDPGENGRIYGYSSESQRVEPAFASLTALFETIAAGFTRGVWRLVDGQLDADVHEFYSLTIELNPGMSYWV